MVGAAATATAEVSLVVVAVVVSVLVFNTAPLARIDHPQLSPGALLHGNRG